MEKLQEILDKHAKWLNHEVGGVRANLQGADLRGANLRYADLWGANLQSANLQDANLLNANLRGTNLRGTNLQDTSLSWVNWHEAKNIRVYVAGLQSSRENAQLTYIPSLDVATTGCWQGTWQKTIERIHSVYAEGTRERQAYDLAIEYIENQMALDNGEATKHERQSSNQKEEVTDDGTK